jgi:glycerate kinase
MKVIIAPDSFKGSLPAFKVAQSLADGWRSCRPNDLIIPIPLADGGEGTCDSLVHSTNGNFNYLEVHDPLMRPIKAKYGTLGKLNCAVAEMATASGIELLTTEELNPLKATSFGTGQLLKHLILSGYKDILLGIGGTATVDGGIGILQALGVVFYDKENKVIPNGAAGGNLIDVAKADWESFDNLVKDVKIKVACDVTNVLTGPNGAAFVFGPQKGATPKVVNLLDENLAHWANCLLNSKRAQNLGTSPGDGAAGGVGFILRNVLKAEISSGAALVIEYAKLKDYLTEADLLITGEGKSDSQSMQGKLCSIVATTAKEYNVPVILCSGALDKDLLDKDKLFAALFSIAKGPGPLADAMEATKDNLYDMAKSIAGIISCIKAN